MGTFIWKFCAVFRWIFHRGWLGFGETVPAEFLTSQIAAIWTVCTAYTILNITQISPSFQAHSEPCGTPIKIVLSVRLYGCSDSKSVEQISMKFYIRMFYWNLSIYSNFGRNRLTIKGTLRPHAFLAQKWLGGEPQLENSHFKTCLK
jgi:hypothetical protein